MKIEKKRGLGEIKITHNKKLFWAIIVLGIILIITIIFIVITGRNSNNTTGNNSTLKECSQDSDCVPVCGCHPDSCIPAFSRGVCDRVICTEECSGPLDCGAGSCGCINNKCNIIKG